MTNRTACVLLAIPIAVLAACTDRPGRTGELRAPAAVAVGEPVSCLSTSQIRTTHVYDDVTIDFETSDHRFYRNTLPVRCAGLGFEKRFAYQTTIGRLCSTDMITVLHTGGLDGPTCGLGQFVPVRLAGG